jgi:hypothetical protein
VPCLNREKIAVTIPVVLWVVAAILVIVGLLAEHP